MDRFDSHHQEPEQRDSLLRKVLKILMFPIAGLSGYWVAAQSVYNSAYDNAKDVGLFNTPSKDTVEEWRRTGKRPHFADKDLKGVDQLVGPNGQRKRRLFGNARSTVEAIVMGEAADIKPGAIEINEEIDAKVAKRMKEAKLGNTWERWKYLRNDQKHMAVIEGLTILGVSTAGLGAVLSYFDNKALAHKIEERTAEHTQTNGRDVA